MKKFVLIIIFMVIFTGCTVNYNLEIDGSLIKEEISITQDSSKIDETIADSNINNAYSSFENNKIIKYKNNKIKNGNFVTYNLYQDYSLSDSLYLRTFMECFDAYKFIYSDDSKKSFIIQTSDGFRCMDYDYQKIDSYKINIKTNHKVIKHNADEVDGNTYTWNINSDNADTKNINFQFEKEYVKNIKDNKKEKKDYKIVLISIITVGLLLLFILIYILSSNKTNNKI